MTASRFPSLSSKRFPIFRGPDQLLQGKERRAENDATLINYNRNLPERFQHIQVIQGKQLTRSRRASGAGDIGAIAQAEGQPPPRSLGDKLRHPIIHPRSFPSPPSLLPSSRKPALMKTKIALHP